MKLLIAIISDEDTEAVLSSLVEQDFRVTRVASTGGFLRRGNTTLFVGLESDQVDEALEVVRQACSEPADANQRKATVFVLEMDRYEQL
jgi:uncharacterized protein YaaQ